MVKNKTSNSRIIYLTILNLLGLGLIAALLLQPKSPPTRSATVLATPPLNPLRGIHAPIGYRWTDADRQLMDTFQDKEGFQRGPGNIVALSADMGAANNSAGVTIERDMLRYQGEGAEVYIRMYPQRFPGGLSEANNSTLNTVSGEPEDLVNDLVNFLQEQQKRLGTHFTRLVPGNEPNLEWPNSNYLQNILPWRSNDDPTKYDAINRYFRQLYTDWETRLKQPDMAAFRDVKLYFPPIAQDGSPDYFGGAYFYDNGQPVENKYDRLRQAISLYPGFSWHNYWRPGHTWQDRVIVHFPDWLKENISSGRVSSAITESGWTPDSMRPDLTEEQAQLYSLWRGPIWSYLGPIPVPQPNQDSTLNNVRFEDEALFFIEQCSGAAYDNPAPAHSVAIWLAGSSGSFDEAVGIQKDGQPRRWFQAYASWRK